MIPSITLVGDKVRLRPIRRDDLPAFFAWLNDPEVFRHLGLARPPVSLADEEGWLADIAAEEDSFCWAIETLDGQLLGDIRLSLWDDDDVTAELGIMIGNKAEWGKGYGTDAICTVLRHAFRDLGLHRVELTTDEDNTRGIRCFEKCGFVREGVLRENRRTVDGHFGNSLLMAILDRELAD